VCVCVCGSTFIADSTDASVEILKTDHTQTTGIQEPGQILHLKPQANYSSSYTNRAEITMLSYIYWQQNTLNWFTHKIKNENRKRNLSS